MSLSSHEVRPSRAGPVPASGPGPGKANTRERQQSKADRCARDESHSGLVKGVAKAPEIAEEDINVMFATNVTGLINMTQAILPIFKKRADGGAGDIINIGSIAGREPYAGGSIYCATKAAVRSFTDALRKELISTRIRVIEIDPGQVETVRPSPLWMDHNFWEERGRTTGGMAGRRNQNWSRLY